MNDSISLTDEQILRCPFETYKQLRDEAPIYKDPVNGVYIVSRYDDIREIASQPEKFSNITNRLGQRDDTPAKAEIDRLYRQSGLEPVRTMVDNDPPDHTRYRKLVDWAFRPARIRGLSGYLEDLANELIDKFAGLGTAEIVRDLAIPLPVLVIADQLGVDRDRIDDFKRWSDALISSADMNITPERHIEVTRDVVEMRKYLAGKVEETRADSQDNIISDLARAEMEGKPLEMKQIVSVLSGLLVAGNETTTSTIALGTQYLIESGLEKKLRDNPETIKAFVEEALRLATPLQGLFRRANEEVTLHGVTIPKDAILMLRWAAGNRDERRFDDPDSIRLDRRNVSQHIAFGFGIHFCVGNALARAELNTVFRVLLHRVRNLRLAGEPELIVHSFARGLNRLPVTFEAVE